MAQCLLHHGWLVLLKTGACCGLPIFFEVTTNWRAGCQKLACPVRREGRPESSSLPLSATRAASPNTPTRLSPTPTRRYFFLVSRHAARHDRLAMHKTRILWCFGLSLLLCGVSFQAARSEELQPKKNENTTDSAPPPSPPNVPVNPVGPATSSATAFDRVTQHLDPG